MTADTTGPPPADDPKPWTRFRIAGTTVRPMLRDGLLGPRFDDYGDAANWADQANADHAARLTRQDDTSA